MTAFWSIVELVKNALAVLRAAFNYAESSKDRAAGRAESERDQAREGEAVQAGIADEAAKPLSEQEAIERMRRGEA